MKLNQNLLVNTAEKSLENAKELLDEAALLKQNNKLSRSYCLYQLSIEEVGKSLFCILFVIDGDLGNKEKAKLFEKNFVSHKSKTKQSILIDTFIARIIFKGNYEGALSFLIDSNDEMEKLNMINDYKNYSLYTSIVNNEVRKPSEVISNLLVEKISTKAINRYSVTQGFISTVIKALPTLKEFKFNNPNHNINIEKSVSDFWKEIIE